MIHRKNPGATFDEIIRIMPVRVYTTETHMYLMDCLCSSTSTPWTSKFIHFRQSVLHLNNAMTAAVAVG
jgi:hypothetical protein